MNKHKLSKFRSRKAISRKPNRKYLGLSEQWDELYPIKISHHIDDDGRIGMFWHRDLSPTFNLSYDPEQHFDVDKYFKDLEL